MLHSDILKYYWNLFSLRLTKFRSITEQTFQTWGPKVLPKYKRTSDQIARESRVNELFSPTPQKNLIFISEFLRPKEFYDSEREQVQQTQSNYPGDVGQGEKERHDNFVSFFWETRLVDEKLI